MRRVLGTPVGAYLPALGLLVISAAYLAIALSYRPEVRAFPAAVAWIMLVLLSLDLVSRTETRIGRAVLRWLNPVISSIKRDATSVTPARQFAAIAWLAFLAAGLMLIGVLYAVPLYVFAALRWHGRRSLFACLLGAGGVTLFIWLMFAGLLRLTLYPGLLFGGA